MMRFLNVLSINRRPNQSYRIVWLHHLTVRLPNYLKSIKGTIKIGLWQKHVLGLLVKKTQILPSKTLCLWVYNTVLVILVCLGITFIIGYNLAYGLVLGILLAILSNFHITLNQVTHASGWEVYKNRFIMPWGIRGQERTVMFEWPRTDSTLLTASSRTHRA